MRWKLLILNLFSAFRLRNKELKLRLFRARFEVFGKNVCAGDVKETVDQTTANFECFDVTTEKFIAFKNVNDFFTVFTDE